MTGQLSLPIPLPIDAQLIACRKLSRMVRERRNSFEIRDFVRRRKAMLKFTRKDAGRG